MKSGIKRQAAIYFDACVYLAFLKNETDYGAVPLNAIKHVWNEAQKGAQVIATSAITVAEVLKHKLDVKTSKVFLEAIRGLHICIDSDIEIAIKAGEYRTYYEKHPVIIPGSNPADKTCKRLTTPDAIHLATCVMNGCTEFWTFDGVRQTTKKDKSIGLLWLNNSVAGTPLVICQPTLAQGMLALPPN